MISIDHEKTRGAVFCPVMRETCEGGKTKSMKGVKCAAWRPLPMFEKSTEMTREVHACSAFEWPPALGYEISGFLQQTRASVDKSATAQAETSKAIARMNQSFCNAAQSSLELKERALLLEEKRLPDADAIKNAERPNLPTGG